MAVRSNPEVDDLRARTRAYTAYAAGTYNINILPGNYETTFQDVQQPVVIGGTSYPTSTKSISFTTTQTSITFANTTSVASTWTLGNTLGGSGRTHVSGVYEGGQFVVVGNSGSIITSVDGIGWTSRTSATATINNNAITYGNGIYLVVGVNGRVQTSPDGITWTSRNVLASTAGFTAAAYGAGTFFIASDAGAVRTSTDGVTWASRASFTLGVFAATFANNIFVIGQAHVIFTSTNGITWTSRTSAFTTNILSITYGNGLFVAGGTGGRLSTSTDGITWTTRNALFGTTAVASIAYSPFGGFTAVGAGGTIRTSTDGITWASSSLPVNFLSAGTENLTLVVDSTSLGNNGRVVTFEQSNVKTYYSDTVTTFGTQSLLLEYTAPTTTLV